VQWWCAATGAAWEWRWVPYPGVWAFVLLVTGAYAALVRSVRADGAEVPRARLLSFSAGVLALWVALDWPVGALGAGYLASVHMVQFLLIGVLAPPLLLNGIPEAGYRRLEARPRLLAAVGRLTHPLLAMAVFTVAIAVTHWPRVVDSMMTTQLGSFALDMVWLGAGLVFSWPVASPVPERPWMTYPVKIGHLLAASILNTGVFAFLTFSMLPVYAVYELAPPITGLSAREDQRIAGLLMKMGGAPILWTWVSILFFRWYRESDKDDAPAESAAAPAGSD
jgi:cytochrome c oxidase assembly factor CtaG